MVRSVNVVPFRRQTRGTVHVMPHERGGYEVGHESSSGSSWGHFSGPYRTLAEAIEAAHALNRTVLNGECAVSISDALDGDLPPSAA